MTEATPDTMAPRSAEGTLRNTPSWPYLSVEQVGRDQREDDRRVGLDHEPWRVDVELAPGDLLVRRRPAVGAVRRRRLGDLAEVSPRARQAPEILVQQRDDADREVPRDATADLEEPEPRGLVGRRVPVDQPYHVLDPALHDARIDVAARAGGGAHVPERGVLPARHEERQVALRGRHEPRALRVDLVVGREAPRAQELVEVLVREGARAGALRLGPQLEHVVLDLPHGLLFRDARVG